MGGRERTCTPGRPRAPTSSTRHWHRPGHRSSPGKSPTGAARVRARGRGCVIGGGRRASRAVASPGDDGVGLAARALLVESVMLTPLSRAKRRCRLPAVVLVLSAPLAA